MIPSRGHLHRHECRPHADAGARGADTACGGGDAAREGGGTATPLKAEEGLVRPVNCHPARCRYFIVLDSFVDGVLNMEATGQSKVPQSGSTVSTELPLLLPSLIISIYSRQTTQFSPDQKQ